MRDLSGGRVLFACGKCGAPRSERIARLSAGLVLHCAQCGAPIDVDAVLREPASGPCACRDAGACSLKCDPAAAERRSPAPPDPNEETG